ncbi:MAG: hypothetical protein LCI02_10075 [Proteobacteria bacterium]|nr:hypothetical protein [Pseudomonadota bacterium]
MAIAALARTMTIAALARTMTIAALARRARAVAKGGGNANGDAVGMLTSRTAP